MSVPAAYLVIVLTWSTTPLAIQWSADGSSFAFALLARMTLSVALASLILLAWRRPLPMDARARRVYLVGGSSLLVADNVQVSTAHTVTFVTEADASEVGSFGYFPEWDELNSSIISPAMDQIWAGEASAADILPATCQQVNDFLAANGFPK